LIDREERERQMMRTNEASQEPDPQNASVLWNAMIAPLLPMQLKGVVWYQGSADIASPSLYSCMFPAMINDWRLHFNNWNLWFGFGSLAAYKEGGSNWSLQRDAQLSALSLPYVFVASGQDLGDEASPWGGIHSRKSVYPFHSSCFFFSRFVC